ncbi:hypothetical protein CDD83_1696 [Cordyceps sp. RAO-2017]|nr:hypothetical protein CDD83_1696 [Cordyceps sp. RAO-2017]
MPSPSAIFSVPSQSLELPRQEGVYSSRRPSIGPALKASMDWHGLRKSRVLAAYARLRFQERSCLQPGEHSNGWPYQGAPTDEQAIVLAPGSPWRTASFGRGEHDGRRPRAAATACLPVQPDLAD